MGTEEIGRIWEQGEALAAGGDLQEAVLCFQRAKTLLIAESKAQYSVDSSKSSKILGDIMERLTGSINRDLGILGKNPVLTLGLKRGYTQKDVKKCYRQMALKYHPDKNTDCDSSCLFTLIQAAYERMVEIAPESIEPIQDGPRTSSASKNTSSTSTSSTSGGMAGRQGARGSSVYAPSGDFSIPSNKDNSRNSSNNTSATTSNSKAPPVYSRHSAAGVGVGVGVRFDPEAAGATTAAQASQVQAMSTDQLRDAIRVFGFQNVDKMNREQLIKKMLAIKSYLDRQKEAQQKQQYTPSTSTSNNSSSSNSSSKAKGGSAGAAPKVSPRGFPGPTDAPPARSKPNEQSYARGASDNVRKDERVSTSTAATQPPAAAAPTGQERERRAAVDERRRQRVDQIARDVPIMSISELKKLMETNNIPLTGCVDKLDLMDRIYAHFGIAPTYSTTSEHNDPDDDVYGSTSRGEQSGKFDIKLPSIFHRGSSGSSKNNDGVSRSNSGASNSNGGGSTTDSAKVPTAPKPGPGITSDKLRDLEERVRNRSMNARGTRNSSSTSSTNISQHTGVNPESNVPSERHQPKTPQKKEEYKPFRRNMPQESIYRPKVDPDILNARSHNSQSSNGGISRERDVPEWMREMQEQQEQLHHKLQSDCFNPDYFADLLHQAALFDLQDEEEEREEETIIQKKRSTRGTFKMSQEGPKIFHGGYHFDGDSEEEGSDTEGETHSSANNATYVPSSSARETTTDKKVNLSGSPIKSSPVRGSPSKRRQEYNSTNRKPAASSKQSSGNHDSDEDFIELHWDHFLPPVKHIPVADTDAKDASPSSSRVGQKAKDDSDINKSPKAKTPASPSSRPVSPIQTDVEPPTSSTVEPTPNRLLKQFLQQDKLSRSFLFDRDQFGDNVNEAFSTDISLPKRGLGDSAEMLRNDESIFDDRAFNSDATDSCIKEVKHSKTGSHAAGRGDTLGRRVSSMDAVIIDEESDDEGIDFNSAYAPFEAVSKQPSPYKSTTPILTKASLSPAKDTGVLYSSAGSGQMFLRTVQLSPSPSNSTASRRPNDNVHVQEV